MKTTNLNTRLLRITAVLSGALILTGQLLFTGNKVSAEIERNVAIAAGRGATAEAAVDIHNGLRLRASISLVRSGSDNSFERRRVRMELINPSGQAVDNLTAEIGHDANQVVQGQNGTLNNPYQLTAPAALGGNGCSHWRITVRDTETRTNLNPDPSNQPITAKVQFFTVGETNVNIPAPAKFGVVQSDTVDRNITVPFTGDLTVQANWDTDEITLDNFQLKFTLINTHGVAVASDTGYSRDSVILGISATQRMKIKYRATCADFGGSQPWKVRVRGSSLGKVKNVDLKASIGDGLF